jgi:hypothetical protein
VGFDVLIGLVHHLHCQMDADLCGSQGKVGQSCIF